MLDQYATDQIYPTTTIGRGRFPAVGTHQIRLQVVGRNAASSAFILSADRFILRR